jgi:hypothetical protein
VAEEAGVVLAMHPGETVSLLTRHAAGHIKSQRRLCWNLFGDASGSTRTRHHSESKGTISFTAKEREGGRRQKLR